jgi:hypothetical protein
MIPKPDQPTETSKKYCCETCKNKNCYLSNESLEYHKYNQILDVGRICIMRCAMLTYGCLSHSDILNFSTQ